LFPACLAYASSNFMELSPSWEATNCAATQELPSILWNWRFITMFKRALHWSLLWARSFQSIPPHSFSLISILILSIHLHLGLPNGLFLFGFPTKILYEFLFPHIRGTCPAHIILLDSIIWTVFYVS
jgi:hypothetical protein